MSIETSFYILKVEQNILNKIDEIIRLLPQGTNEEFEKLMNYSTEELNEIHKKYYSDSISMEYMNLLCDNIESSLVLKVRENIVKKVEETIKNNIRDRYEHIMDDIMEEKDSILYKLMGRNKLKAARIDNLIARLLIEIIDVDASNPEKSFTKMFVEMYKYANKYCEGVLPQEFQEIENIIRSSTIFSGETFPTNDELYKQVAESIGDQKSMVPNITIRKHWPFNIFYNFLEVDRLNSETERLNEIKTKAELIKKNKKKFYSKIDNTYSEINSFLKSIYSMIILPAKREEKIPIKKRETKESTWNVWGE